MSRESEGKIPTIEALVEYICLAKLQMICDSFVDSEYGKRYSKKDNVGDQSSIQIMPQPNSNVYKRNIFEQFSILTQRVFLTNLREPLITSVRISQTIVSTCTQKWSKRD